MALANCEKIDFVAHVITSHLYFTVTLAEGKIATIGPVTAELD